MHASIHPFTHGRCAHFPHLTNEKTKAGRHSMTGEVWCRIWCRIQAVLCAQHVLLQYFRKETMMDRTKWEAVGWKRNDELKRYRETNMNISQWPIFCMCKEYGDRVDAQILGWERGATKQNRKHMADVCLGGKINLTVKFKASVRNSSGNVHRKQDI